jgi:hypothetical protein
MAFENSTGRYSPGSIFVYVLPGVTLIAGFFILARLSGWHSYSFQEIKWFTGTVLLFCGWGVGIIFSGVADHLSKLMYRVFANNSLGVKIPLQDLRMEFHECFRREFNIRLKGTGLSDEHAMLMKNFIAQFMPGIAASYRRQSEWTHLKASLILPVIIWTINGVMFSLTAVTDSQDQIILLLSIVAGGYFLVISLWLSLKADETDGWKSMLISFIALSKSGITRS